MKRLIILVLILFATGCSYNIKPNISRDTIYNSSRKIDTNVAIYIDGEFENYIYGTTHGDNHLNYYYGEALRDIIKSYFDNIFTKTAIVSTLANDKQYDWIAIPKFVSTNSTTEGFFYWKSVVGVKVEFQGKAGKVFSAIGNGEEIVSGTVFNVENTGKIALNNALINLREDIIHKKDLFIGP